MIKIKGQKRVLDCTLVKEYCFKNGYTAPLYDVVSMQGLNQIIGYFKIKYKNYGNVYYRGQNELHNMISPSGMRTDKISSYNKCNQKINLLIKKCVEDAGIIGNLMLKNKGEEKEIIIESVLQHYGIDTRCIDVVDNHWVALWFGLYRYEKIIKQSGLYARYKKRDKETDDEANDEKYQYILLIAADTQKDIDNNVSGICYGDDIVTIDLRQCIPSYYIRPHAQHGVILKKNLHETNETFDLSGNVVAILRMKIKDVDNWLGNGGLLTADNLFPSEFYDTGYDVLLSRIDLFNKQTSEISRFVY